MVKNISIIDNFALYDTVYFVVYEDRNIPTLIFQQN